MSKAHRQSASQLLLAALSGSQINPQEKQFFAAGSCVGVTLFRRNIAADYTAVSHLSAELQKLIAQAGRPAMIAIDQEGGRVARFKQPFPDEGPALRFAGGASDDAAVQRLYDYGARVGKGLLALGVNVNFAPVADICSNAANPIIGDRAFGSTVEEVVIRARAFLRGQNAAGVAGCLKHFPGQGDGSVDTHLDGDTIDVDEPTLRARELRPFMELMPLVGMIMISHSIFPAWDSVPASLSKVVMTDLLRGELGYRGLIVSDDMNMKAVAQDDKAWQEAIISAIAHGADLILVCEHLERCSLALEAMTREMGRSPAFHKRVEESAARIWEFRRLLRFN